MQFIDLKSQYESIAGNINQAINKVLDHGKYIMGAEVKELEEKLANYVSTKHAIACANGTDALTLALMSIDLQPDDEVIMPSFTYYATAEAVGILRGKPVFVDVKEDNFNINEDLIEQHITDKTKAIMPVSLYGQCADLDRINDLAQKYNLYVIEDAAQSFGAEYKGKKSANLSHIATTSFFPSKPLGCYGDGGMCFSNDEAIAEKIRSLRIHGQEKRYYHNLIGMNSRLDSIQAAILLEKFKIFPKELELRAEIAAKYNQALKDKFQIPIMLDYNTKHAYAQYTIKVSDRETIQNKLKDNNIPSVVYYPVPLPFQTVFKDLNYQQKDFPISMELSKTVLSLPMSPYLKEAEQNKIIETLLKD